MRHENAQSLDSTTLPQDADLAICPIRRLIHPFYVPSGERVNGSAPTRLPRRNSSTVRSSIGAIPDSGVIMPG